MPMSITANSLVSLKLYFFMATEGLTPPHTDKYIQSNPNKDLTKFESLSLKIKPEVHNQCKLFFPNSLKEAVFQHLIGSLGL